MSEEKKDIMQIVIDIPEDVYKRTVFYREFRDLSDCVATIKALEKATPLPKGHGRLIDYGYVVDAIDDWVNAEEYRYTNATDYLRKRVANTPTTIEADKEVRA